MIELLAPAKDKICAKAAIDYGADAIYIGASEFGARKNVPNSLSDIQEIVQYAHKFNVKVYAAINTILTDEEIIQAKKLIEELTRIGVDAVIIQDMGLIRKQKTGNSQQNFLQYHASTQCDNRTPEKVKFLESVGFSRVILARELSIEQIKEIKSQTNVELEAFIHGALCVSYSGQCYLSQLIGGRSANRGECAQPCRKKYSLVDEDGNFIAKDKYLLSLKDFNASKHLKALADAGITSFKIEGRLKDENYVKNVVGYYRKLIDELGLGKTSSGEIQFDFEPNLEKSFNRGFTDYFVDGKRKEIYSFDSPKSKGEYIGKVTKTGGNYFEIADTLKSFNLNQPPRISPQDGLCFDFNGTLSGCLVNKVDEVEAFRSGKFAKQQKIFPYKMKEPNTRLSNFEPPHLSPLPQGARKIDNIGILGGIKVGTEIYRNFDSEFEKKLKSSKTCRKIRANIEFDLGKIKVVDEDKNSAEILYKFEELAQNEEKMGQNIIGQLKKSGDTDFLIEEVNVLTQKIPFLPVSRLNELRRELLEKLAEQRAKCKMQNAKSDSGCESHISSLPLPSSLSVLDYKANVLNKYAKEFYEAHGCKVTEMALESTQKSKNAGKIAMTTKHCLKYAFGMCKSKNTEQSHHAPKKLYLIDEKGKRYELKFDCQNCEMEIIF